MKKTLVIYDSAFGNTEMVAQAMGEALASQTEVEVVRVTDVRPEQLEGLDLLFVGSPVQRFQALPAINTFLDSIPDQGLAGVKVAAFDTRILMEDVEFILPRQSSETPGVDRIAVLEPRVYCPDDKPRLLTAEKSRAAGIGIQNRFPA